MWYILAPAILGLPSHASYDPVPKPISSTPDTTDNRSPGLLQRQPVNQITATSEFPIPGVRAFAMKQVFPALFLSIIATMPVSGQVAPYSQVLEDGKKTGGAQPGVATAKGPMKIGDKVYDHLEFIITNGEMATFESKQGPLTVKWSDLPKDVQEYFAQAYEESMKAQATATIQDFATPVLISGSVAQKLPQGLLVRMEDRTVLLTGHPKEAGIANGDAISVNALRTGMFQYKEASGATKMLQKFKVAKSP